MGKPCFSKAVKFFAFALLGAATAIAAIAVLSAPAVADPSGGDGGDVMRRIGIAIICVSAGTPPLVFGYRLTATAHPQPLDIRMRLAVMAA